jgi:hypothetical protein
MGAREKIRESAGPFLEPGENIQAAFTAQTGPNPNWMFLSYLIMFAAKFYAIVVTDRRILVLQTSSFRPARAKGLVTTAPRETRFGDMGGLWGDFTLNGTKYYVHRRFFKDVEAADNALGSGTQAAPAPTTS